MPDPFLTIVICLLGLTLAAWVFGAIPYPFGLLILLSLLVYRCIHLVANNQDQKRF